MEIEGLVHWPHQYRQGRRYPLLLVPHGGTALRPCRICFVNGEYRIFAMRGWAVYRPNFRGSGHYGEKFLRANLGSWGVGDYQDVISGVDHLIKIGLADPRPPRHLRVKLRWIQDVVDHRSDRPFQGRGRWSGRYRRSELSSDYRMSRSASKAILGKDIVVYQRSSPLTYADNIKDTHASSGTATPTFASP